MADTSTKAVVYWRHHAQYSQHGQEFAAFINDIAAERDTLRALLREARDELQAYIDAEYKHTVGYPTMDRKRERDMGLVRRIAEALGESGDGNV